MTNSLWAIALVLALAFLTFLAYSVNPRTAPIIALHNALWAGTLSLFASNLIEYNSASPQAWLTLFAGLVFFNIGAIFAAPLKSKTVLRPEPHLRDSNPALMTRTTFLALYVLYLMAFAYYLWAVLGRFGLATLITSPEDIRGAEGESYLAMIPFGIRALLYLGPILIAACGLKSAVHRPLPIAIRAMTMLTLIASMILMLQRTNLFMGILLLTCLYLTSPEAADFRKRLATPSTTKKLVGAATAGVLLLGAFLAIANAFNPSGSIRQLNPAVSPALASSGLYSPYHYATSGTAGFLGLVDSTNDAWPDTRRPGQLLIGDNNPQTWGAALFAPVLKAVPIAEPWNYIAPFIDVGVLTNVFTWHEYFYRDFRQLGLALGMLAYGFTAGLLFQLRNVSVRLYWLNAAVMVTVMFSVFVPKLTDTLFIAMVLTILLLSGRPARLRINSLP